MSAMNAETAAREIEALAPSSMQTFFLGEHWASLQQRYAELHRRYHDLRHVAEVAQHFAAVGARWENPSEVYCALLYHDAIYAPVRMDNEEQSALLARSELATCSLGVDVASVERLIRSTAHHGAAHSNFSNDEAYLLDCDSAILGTEPTRYDEYAQGVRKEYSYVPTALLAKMRSRFLNNLLMQPSIFSTPLFETSYGPQARQNVQRELSQLATLMEQS
jgi:predicted metal-dependent HD superfamily phosphohydrolase